MAKTKLHQVPLVSATGPTQPPFPGGWVLGVFDVIHGFAPAFAKVHRLPGTSRTGTGSRIKQGASINEASYQDLESILVRIITVLFPRTASVNQFAEKYVTEYFRLWSTSAKFAPIWVKALGFESAPSGVIARALIRDLILRLCYLESCERKLKSESFSEWELSLLKPDSLAHVYQALINARTKPRGVTLEALARKLGTNEKSLRRFKKGEYAPPLVHLFDLKQTGETHRLLVGIGFIDGLLRKLNLRDGALQTEILHVAESFLPRHRQSLDSFTGRILHQNTDETIRSEAHDFEHYIAYGDNLLLHPGFESVWAEPPYALWRAHLHSLRFACVLDLAQAYYQFSEPENDRPLESFFHQAERESAGCPHYWITKLGEPSTVLPFKAPL
jgi:hypothetical protein